MSIVLLNKKSLWFQIYSIHFCEVSRCEYLFSPAHFIEAWTFFILISVDDYKYFDKNIGMD